MLYTSSGAAECWHMSQPSIYKLNCVVRIAVKNRKRGSKYSSISSYLTLLTIHHIHFNYVLILAIVGLYPKGRPSRNSRRPETSPGLRGGLEIVFNQQ
ncbi:uncharacterized protein LOC111299517 [Durio zibethinus]|uniref:Uncharacterized protein LOC111299517 n=1 Tax=Durio zibethinus TaxID=66656 RepID=A0A6P5ZEU4_DURZI|nr:uncharacterized protein LOC111299517 [Durio zibethinus]